MEGWGTARLPHANEDRIYPVSQSSWASSFGRPNLCSAATDLGAAPCDWVYLPSSLSSMDIRFRPGRHTYPLDTGAPAKVVE